MENLVVNEPTLKETGEWIDKKRFYSAKISINSGDGTTNTVSTLTITVFRGMIDGTHPRVRRSFRRNAFDFMLDTYLRCS